MAYRAVIFDLDGLLIDSETLIEEAWRLALREIGYDLPHKVFVPLVGVHTGVIGQTFAQRFGIGQPAFERLYQRRSELLMDFYQYRLSPAYLKPGADELISLLETNAVPRALATLTRRATVDVMLKRTGLAGRFNLLVCGDELQNPKPAPDIYLETARRLGLQPDECIVLEDSAAGILAASRAGMLPMLVPDLLEPPPEVAALAHAQYASLTEAAPEIARLFALPRQA